MKLISLLAAFIYRGHLITVRDLIKPKSQEFFSTFKFILDLLNTTHQVGGKSFSDQKILKKLSFDGVKNTLTLDDEFDKLLNFRQHNYFESDKILHSMDRDVAETVMLQ